jgi:hypothetical protein
LVCPICGSLPADNGTDTSKTNNVVNAGTGLDVNGNAPHCPLCGTAQLVVDQTKVTTQTGVAALSQVPADIDAVYVTGANAALEQPVAVATRTLTGLPSKFTHGYATPNRGTATITAETVNGTTAE